MNKPWPISPSAVANECFCLALRRASRAVSRRYDEAMRTLDLNNGQFSMLTSIAGLQPVAIQTLADHLAMDRTTVTAALKPLERRELVEIGAADTDQRSREVWLTPAGSALLAQAMPLWRDAQRQTSGALEAADADLLRRQLAAIG